MKGKIIKNLLIIFTFCLICKNGYSLSVSCGNLSLEFDEDGSITQVFAYGQPLPMSSSFGGILLRDLTDANIPAGTENFLEDFESTMTNWIVYPGSKGVEFSISTNEAYTGTSSLLCVVTNESGNQLARLVSPLIKINPEKKYRIQCVYKAARGYLSYENSNHATRWLYNEYNRSAGNSIGYYICSSNGSLKTGHLVVAPFVAQAQEWKAVGGEIYAGDDDEYLRVTISANLNPDYDMEGFYVDKIQVFELPVEEKNVTGSAAQTLNGISFTGAVDNFSVEAEWTGMADSIDIFCRLQTTKNVDCPLDLIISLPVLAEGWNWLYDSEISKKIEAREKYSHSVSADYQSDLPVSLYPYGGISTGDVCVALSLPLMPPVLCELRYNNIRQALEAVFHLGLSAGLNHGSAEINLRLTALPGENGFRGIIKWYHDEFSESDTWFETEFVSTNYLSWDRRDYSGANAELCAAHDTQQIMSVEYTVPDLVVHNVGTTNDVPPTLTGLLGIVTTNSFTGTKEQQYYFTNIAPRIKRASNGDPVLKYLAVKTYTGGRIQGVFKINASPLGIEKGYHTYITNYVCGPAFRDTIAITAVLDAVQLDNFLSKTTINCATEDIARSSFDLTYTPNDYTVGITPAASLCEYLSWLRRWIDENTAAPYRAILINWWGLATPNACLPWVDICAGEVNGAIVGGEYGEGYKNNYDPIILRYKRALAYHKVLGMAFEGNGITSNDVIDTLQNSLLYAMGCQFKQGVGLVDISYTDCVKISHLYTKAASKINKAGWQPIVFASNDNSEVFLERYGGSSEGRFFLVAQNSGSNAASGTIYLSDDLCVSNDWEVIEYLSGAVVSFSGASDDLRIVYSNLPPRRVKVYKISLPVPETLDLAWIIEIMIIYLTKKEKKRYYIFEIW